MGQLVIEGLIDGIRCLQVESRVKGSEVIQWVRESVGTEEINVMCATKFVRDDTLIYVPEDGFTVVRVCLLLKGGKGGFGKLLKGSGKESGGSKNVSSSRHISGKRMRQVEEEKDMEEWESKQLEKSTLNPSDVQKRFRTIKYGDTEKEEICKFGMSCKRKGICMYQHPKGLEEKKKPEVSIEEDRIFKAIERGLYREQKYEIEPVDTAIELKADTAQYEEIDISVIESVEELKSYGMNCLRWNLSQKGLLCGGTLDQRAERLFLLKSIPLKEIPLKYRAKAVKPSAVKKRLAEFFQVYSSTKPAYQSKTV